MSENKNLEQPSEGLDIELRDLYACNGTYTPEEKIEAVMAYMVTGTSRKASKICGVPEGTIRWWKSQSLWWDDTMSECRKKKQDELDAMTTNVIHQAVEQIANRITHGNKKFTKDGEEYSAPLTAQELAMVTGIIFDKRQLIRGDPTSHAQTSSDADKLDKLREEFQKMAHEVQGHNAKIINDVEYSEETTDGRKSK